LGVYYLNPLLIAVHFILVHGPDQQEIDLNVNEISSIRDPKDSEDMHYAKGTNCVIVMTNGKIISAIENCSDIIKKISENEK
jgi:hypothetical protein